MTEKEKLTLIEDTLETEPGVLSSDTLLSDVQEYDSLKKLTLMIMMEDNFNVKLTSSQIAGFTKVADILELMV